MILISLLFVYNNNIRNTSYGHGQYDGQGKYCDPSTASEVFLIFTTRLYSCYAVVMQ